MKARSPLGAALLTVLGYALIRSVAGWTTRPRPIAFRPTPGSFWVGSSVRVSGAQMYAWTGDETATFTTADGTTYVGDPEWVRHMPTMPIYFEDGVFMDGRFDQ